MKIVVDVFGGDYAPFEIVAGAVKALQENVELELVLVGDKDKITEILQKLVFVSDRLEIVHAPDVVTMDESPTIAIRTKKTSSIVVAYDYLKQNDDAVALVSAGSTGATLTGAVLKLGRVKGVSRPALAPVLPTMNDGNVMLLDCGANAECKAENLLDFAIMGNEYMKAMGVKKPRIALLNIGTEEEKGSEMIKEAHQPLKNAKLNFVGNIEARDILTGDYDVIVCDGFSGNVALKGIEGAVSMILKLLKQSIYSSFMGKIGGLFLKKTFKKLKARLDYNNHGGALLLGVNKAVIKAHGSSKRVAIKAAVLQAAQYATFNISEKISEKLELNASVGTV